MNTTTLRRLGACEDAVEWAEQQPNAATAWSECKRADWMLWLLGRLSGCVGSAARKRLVLCACACARTALRYVPAGEDRPRVAIEIAERYCRGEATLEDVRTAAAAAAAAKDAADAAYAAYADAANAATAATAATAAAAAAAAAAADAAYVAAAYAADAASAAQHTELERMADIAREHYPQPPRLPGKKRKRGEGK